MGEDRPLLLNMKNQEINISNKISNNIGSKKLVVLGGGESGVGTAILGKQKGYEVFVSDKGEIAEKYKEVLLHNNIDFCLFPFVFSLFVKTLQCL